MELQVTFDDSGKVENHEFDFKPEAGQQISLFRDGKETQYFVLTASGPIHGNTPHLTAIRVRAI